jgi:translation initiation factor 6 (eIF-6)
MPEYTVTTDAAEEEALQWVAASADPPQDAATYFDARMHEVLHSYVQQHAVGTAVAPVDDVAVEYAKASTEQQAQVANILGVQVTRPA